MRTKTDTLLKNWEVLVYNEEGRVHAKRFIYQKTKEQAESEAKTICEKEDGASCAVSQR